MALWALALIQFTHIMDFMILMPLGPQLMRVFSLSPQQFGFLVSIYTLTAAASGFFSSFIVDRFDRKKTLQVIYALFLVATLSCAFATSYYFLLISRFFSGAFGGILASTVLAIVGDLVPVHERAGAMGFIMIGFSLASVFGVPFGLYLASLYSWHVPFIFLSLCGIAVFTAIMVFIPPISGHLDHQSTFKSALKTFRSFFKVKRTRAALALTFTMTLGQFAIIPFISPYMVFNVGFTEKQLSLIYILGGLASVIASPLVGKIADKAGHAKVFRIAAVCSIIPMMAITTLGHVGLAVALFFTTCFFIVVSGRIVPAMALISSAVTPQHRGAFMGINSCVQQLTAGLASILAARIIVQNSAGALTHYSTIGILASITSLVAVVLVGYVKEIA